MTFLQIYKLIKLAQLAVIKMTPTVSSSKRVIHEKGSTGYYSDVWTFDSFKSTSVLSCKSDRCQLFWLSCRRNQYLSFVLSGKLNLLFVFDFRISQNYVYVFDSHAYLTRSYTCASCAKQNCVNLFHVSC